MQMVLQYLEKMLSSEGLCFLKQVMKESGLSIPCLLVVRNIQAGGFRIMFFNLIVIHAEWVFSLSEVFNEFMFTTDAECG